MGERYAFSKVSWDNGVLTITVYDSEEKKFFEFVYRAFDFLALTERAAVGAQSTNIQRAEIIAKITEVVGSWFRNSDDLNHRECDILNSIAKCYKRQ
jgi:hypothetical protein